MPIFPPCFKVYRSSCPLKIFFFRIFRGKNRQIRPGTRTRNAQRIGSRRIRISGNDLLVFSSALRERYILVMTSFSADSIEGEF